MKNIFLHAFIYLTVFINSITAQITWSGASSTFWNVNTNWVGGVVPGSSDNVIIPDVSGASNRFPIVRSSGASCNNLTVSAGATITIGNGSVELTI